MITRYKWMIMRYKWAGIAGIDPACLVNLDQECFDAWVDGYYSVNYQNIPKYLVEEYLSLKNNLEESVSDAVADAFADSVANALDNVEGVEF